MVRRMAYYHCHVCHHVNVERNQQRNSNWRHIPQLGVRHYADRLGRTKLCHYGEQPAALPRGPAKGNRQAKHVQTGLLARRK